MEYLLQNMDWLQDALDTYNDDEYIIIDCPGQIELYTHIPVMNKIIDTLRLWGYGQSMVSVFVVDATFVTDPAKFISGSLLALSAMISMQLPHVNILSKCDLVEEASMDRILEMESALQLWDVLGNSGDSNNNSNYNNLDAIGDDETDRDDDDRGSIQSLWSLRNHHLQSPSSSSNANSSSNNAGTDTKSSSNNNNSIDNTQQQHQQTNSSSSSMSTRRNIRETNWHKLTEAICSLLDDYSMVGFLPLNINDEDSIAHVLATVDHAIQYGEDLEVRGADYDDDVGEME
jgi:hypothetical protein